MTTDDWHTTKGHAKMLFVPQVAANERGLRLFGVACLRHIPTWSTERRVLEALTATERFADGELTRTEFVKRYTAISRRYNSLLATKSGRNSKSGRAETTYLLACMYAMAPDDPLAVRHAADRLIGSRDDFGGEVVTRLRKMTPHLLRDIFGNPFRPVAFDPAWRSESAVALARTAYDTRNFSLLPILADALEEAGCDHPDVLAHCRQPDATHVRGCWVVDGVLGKC
jgi:hypothetical protein